MKPPVGGVWGILAWKMLTLRSSEMGFLGFRGQVSLIILIKGIWLNPP